MAVPRGGNASACAPDNPTATKLATVKRRTDRCWIDVTLSTKELCHFSIYGPLRANNRRRPPPTRKINGIRRTIRPSLYIEVAIHPFTAALPHLTTPSCPPSSPVPSNSPSFSSPDSARTRPRTCSLRVPACAKPSRKEKRMSSCCLYVAS